MLVLMSITDVISNAMNTIFTILFLSQIIFQEHRKLGTSNNIMSSLIFQVEKLKVSAFKILAKTKQP
jgi:hypothetical protein